MKTTADSSPVAALPGDPMAEEGRRLRMTMLALEHIGESIYWLGLDGRILYVNHAAERELGYSAEELQQMHVWDIDPNVPPEMWGKDGSLAKSRHHISSGLRNFRTQHRRRDGRLIPVEINSGHFDYEGETYAIAICNDITERLAAEEALRASQTKFSAIFSMTPDPMALTRLDDGTVLDISASYADFFGYSRDEIVGRTTLAGDLGLWADDEERQRWRAQLEPCGQVQGHEARLRRKDGSMVTVLISGKVIEMEGERCVIVVLRDISQRKKMEELLRKEKAEQAILIRKLEDAQAQLLQSEKLASIGQLAAGVAHEINNPLGFVRSNLHTLGDYADRLVKVMSAFGAAEAALDALPGVRDSIARAKRDADLDFLLEDLPSLIAESIEGADRVRGIVQNLRDFARIDSAEWRRADIHAGLESTINVVWNEIRHKAELIRNYGELPPIECIPSRLNQVFMNILVNATQAIPEHGIITVATRRCGDEVEIAITDNGEGIPADAVAKIFDPFYTTKPVGRGTGLGLAVSYGIVRDHGGSIAVESAPGAGTTFRIRLPIDRAP